MTLLILTRSDELGVDLLSDRLHGTFLRINIDKLEMVKLQFEPDRWDIFDGNAHLDSSEPSQCWMWKCGLDRDEADNFFLAEIEYTFREVYAWYQRRKLTRGNAPDYHKTKGKMYFLSEASKFFHTPNSVITLNSTLQLKHDLVAKSLASEPFSDGRVLYTSRIDSRDIDESNLWFFQEFQNSDLDITVYFAGSTFFSFARERRLGESIDWRQDISLDPYAKRWQPIELFKEHNRQIDKFRTELGIEWGRADFLMSPKNDLIFLEYNANGQFGFLDPEGKNGLLDAIAGYLEY